MLTAGWRRAITDLSDELKQETTTMTRIFAAYDDNGIYGIGSTADAALADAESYGATNLRTAPVSRPFGRKIERDGYNAATDTFGLVHGVIVSGRALDRIHAQHEAALYQALMQ